ncbi:SH3 domain-containing protein [Metabacillus idriensis]|uniref:SH3 domain-containing protein n=1 Tax=Metabacillus idriensis TaxID=324768 RepID=UPI00174E0174|nr:SH3 domain-containing protein [Metabacillus idriensis]
MFFHRNKFLLKLSASVITFILLASSFLPAISNAQADGEVQNENQKVISLIEDYEVTSKDKQKKAVLLKGSKFYAEANQSGEYEIMIGSDWYVLDKKSFIESSFEFKELPDMQLPENPIGTFTASEEVDLYADKDYSVKIASLKTPDAFPVFYEETDLLASKIGDRIVFILKNDVIYKALKPEADNNKTNDEIETKDSSNNIDQEITNENIDKNADMVKNERKTTSKVLPKIEAEVSINTATKQAASTKALQSKAPKPSVSRSTTHIKVIDETLSVYDNSTGKLIRVGALIKNQTYPIEDVSGNWIKIKFGNGYGFIWREGVVPSSSKYIPNPNKGLSSTGIKVYSNQYLSVYDNTSGKLIQFGTIEKNKEYPIISESGNWYKINFLGRIGYIYKPATNVYFGTADRYFKVTEKTLTVYDNSSGKLVPVGGLDGGQIYPRVGDMGNWHKIKVGDGFGFVWKNSTVPASSKSVKNINYSLINTDREIESNQYLSIYDNTSGNLVRFGQIGPNKHYPIINSIGNWYKIDFAGRIGYVYKPASKLVFKNTDSYFKVEGKDLAIFDNRSGDFVQVGTLSKNQVFERIGATGKWHKIQFGHFTGYVSKDETLVSSKSQVSNLNNNKSIDRSFISNQLLPVYDNSSGKLIKMGTLKQGIKYPIINVTGNWITIDFSGRTGYVYKTGAQMGPVVSVTKYNISLESALDKQLAASPKTDKYGSKAYVASQYVSLNSKNPSEGTVTANNLNVREEPSADSWALGQLEFGTTITIVSTKGSWYEIKYQETWKNAKPSDVEYYLDPNNFASNTNAYYQFLNLSKSASVSANELNSKILKGKGILEGQGEAFIKAGLKFNINEIYLISHAQLETGNGSSQLANGIILDSVRGTKLPAPVKVYNMYGVGALDSCPAKCGAEYAYDQDWFTPAAAIIGGAEFISERYVNHKEYKQNTLYKMRWNPEQPATHQYATDIGWAYKQVGTISKLYGMLSDYTLHYDVPEYK